MAPAGPGGGRRASTPGLGGGPRGGTPDTTARARVERDRGPEPPPGRNEIDEEGNAREEHGPAGPGARQKDEHVGARVDSMVVLVERYGAAARDRRGSEPECEPPVVGVTELRCEEGPDRSDNDERPGPL